MSEEDFNKNAKSLREGKSAWNDIISALKKVGKSFTKAARASARGDFVDSSLTEVAKSFATAGKEGIPLSSVDRMNSTLSLAARYHSPSTGKALPEDIEKTIKESVTEAIKTGELQHGTYPEELDLMQVEELTMSMVKLAWDHLDNPPLSRKQKALAKGYKDTQYNAALEDTDISGFERHQLQADSNVANSPGKGKFKAPEQQQDSASTSEVESGATRSGKWGDGLRGNAADNLRGDTNTEGLVSSLTISDPENVIDTDLDMIRHVNEERSLLNADQERLSMIAQTKNTRPSGFLNGLSGNMLLQS